MHLLLNFPSDQLWPLLHLYLLNSPFTSSSSPLILNRYSSWEHSPHLYLSTCILRKLKLGKWIPWKLGFHFVGGGHGEKVGIMERKWPSVDPWAGPGESEPLCPLPVLGIYIPPTISTLEAASTMQPRESNVLLRPCR